MKILLDECVPWPMYKLLPTHSCTTAQREGWQGIKNGELLRRAEEKFDLFISSDQNIHYQQNLAGRNLPVLLLSTNKLRQIQAAAGLLQQTVDSMTRGGFFFLEIP
ncbi:MAG TPA: DUF5615 family PIN-like protein [Candidatus Dormibacteraeota bacterium]|nr:DUF5615 family PIN-like protein [Candidatus Dormibacteraeota bacterium]